MRWRTCWLRCLCQRPTPRGKLRLFPWQQEGGGTWSGPWTPRTTCPPANAKPAARISTGKALLPAKAPPRYPTTCLSPAQVTDVLFLICFFSFPCLLLFFPPEAASSLDQPTNPRSPDLHLRDWTDQSAAVWLHST